MQSILTLCLVATWLLWGSTFLVTRLAVTAWPPFTLVFARCAIGSLFLTCLRPTGSRMGHRDVMLVAATAILLFVGGHGLLATAQQGVPSGIAAIFMSTIPLWLAMLTAAYERQWPTYSQLGALLAGIAGVSLLVIARTDSVPETSLLSATLLLGSAVSWACGSILTRVGLAHHDPVNVCRAQLAAGALPALAVALLGGEMFGASAFELKPVLAVLFLGLVSSGAVYLAYVWLLRHVGPIKAGSYALVNPMVAVVAGWVFAEETITAEVLGACLLVSLSVAAQFHVLAMRGK